MKQQKLPCDSSAGLVLCCAANFKSHLGNLAIIWIVCGLNLHQYINSVIVAVNCIYLFVFVYLFSCCTWTDTVVLKLPLLWVSHLGQSGGKESLHFSPISLLRWNNKGKWDWVRLLSRWINEFNIQEDTALSLGCKHKPNRMLFLSSF